MSRSFLNTMIRLSEQHLREQQRALREAQKAERAAERAQKDAERGRIYDEKQKKRLYQEERAAEVQHLNDDLASRLDQLQSVLTDGLERNTVIDVSKMMLTPSLPALDLSNLEKQKPVDPEWSEYEPSPLTGLASLLPWRKTEYEQALADAQQAFDNKKREVNDRRLLLQKTIDSHTAAHLKEVERINSEAAAFNAKLNAWREALAQLDKTAIEDYVLLVLNQHPLPIDFPKAYKVAFVAASKQIVLEYDLPEIGTSIPTCKGYSYVRASDKVNESPLPEKQRRALYSGLIAQAVLRALHDIFQSDNRDIIESIVLNGYVDTIDPSNGQRIRPCIVTVRVTKDSFSKFNLKNVDPIAALQALNASFSKSPAELAPVRPLLEFDMVDPRFIKEADVLSTLDQRPNLMELTPAEFESLITNLFRKMGLETRQTQASRDGGVDCVAFDSRPIFGGKIVIQAKRYKNTVGVSAVRDLYGTMQNEGASKGILVTTSGYGRAAFDFSSGKSMELLDGGNLCIC